MSTPVQNRNNKQFQLTKKGAKRDLGRSICGLNIRGNLLAACESGGQKQVIIYERKGEADLSPVFSDSFRDDLIDLKWAPSGAFLGISGYASGFPTVAKLFIITEKKDSE